MAKMSNELKKLMVEGSLLEILKNGIKKELTKKNPLNPVKMNKKFKVPVNADDEDVHYLLVKRHNEKVDEFEIKVKEAKENNMFNSDELKIIDKLLAYNLRFQIIELA